MLRTIVLSVMFAIGGFVIYNHVNMEERVSGIVNFEDGDSAPYAEIKVYSKSTNDLVLTRVADEDGQFSLEELKPGAYEIELGYTGYESHRESVEIKNGDNENLGEIELSSLFSDDQYTIRPGKRDVVGS